MTTAPTPTTSNPTLYLCIDCGGTKTAAVVADTHGAVLARTLGPGSNVTYLGVDAFLRAVASASGAALAAALGVEPFTLPFSSSSPSSTSTTLPPFTLAAAWLGVSGLDSPASARTLLPLVSALFTSLPHHQHTPRVTLSNDTHLLASPVRTLPDVHTAVAVVAGTGSIVQTFREADSSSEGDKESAPLQAVARAGGLGWILGDEGGGFDVGRTALRALCAQRDAEDAAGPDAEVEARAHVLRDRVLAWFGVADVLDLLTIVHLPDPIEGEGAGESKDEGNSKENGENKEPVDYTRLTREARLSTLSPLVFAAALDDGDPLALRVLDECAAKLAEQVAGTLAAPGAPPSAHRIAAADSVICFGGSLVALDVYRERVLAALARAGHVFRHVAVVRDPATAGAKALAAAV